MKRFLSVILALLFLFPLIACNAAAEAAENKSDARQNNSQAEENTTSPPSQTDQKPERSAIVMGMNYVAWAYGVFNISNYNEDHYTTDPDALNVQYAYLDNFGIAYDADTQKPLTATLRYMNGEEDDDGYSACVARSISFFAALEYGPPTDFDADEAKRITEQFTPRFNEMMQALSDHTTELSRGENIPFSSGDISYSLQLASDGWLMITASFNLSK